MNAVQTKSFKNVFNFRDMLYELRCSIGLCLSPKWSEIRIPKLSVTLMVQNNLLSSGLFPRLIQFGLIQFQDNPIFWAKAASPYPLPSVQCTLVVTGHVLSTIFPLWACPRKDNKLKHLMGVRILRAMFCWGGTSDRFPNFRLRNRFTSSSLWRNHFYPSF